MKVFVMLFKLFYLLGMSNFIDLSVKSFLFKPYVRFKLFFQKVKNFFIFTATIQQPVNSSVICKCSLNPYISAQNRKDQFLFQLKMRFEMIFFKPVGILSYPVGFNII